MEPQTQETKSFKPFADLLYFVGFIAAVLLGSLLINNFIFRTFNVVGPSMEPTLFTGERLIVNKIPVTWQHIQGKPYSPNRGEIIVFKNPMFESGGADEYIVKRVIAFAGERVVVRDGEVTVYNDQNPDGFNPDDKAPGPKSPTSGSVDRTVPENEIFVSGDNRVDNFSLDSRNGLGTVPLYDLQGPVSMRLYPFDRMRLF